MTWNKGPVKPINGLGVYLSYKLEEVKKLNFEIKIKTEKNRKQL